MRNLHTPHVVSFRFAGTIALLAGAVCATLTTFAQSAASTAPASAPATASSAIMRNPSMRASLEMSSLSGSLDRFLLDNSRFPTSAEGLGALVKCPTGLEKTWKGPYTDKSLTDPWGHPYLYLFPSPKNKDIFDLSCAGPDGKPNTPDDIPAP